MGTTHKRLAGLIGLLALLAGAPAHAAVPKSTQVEGVLTSTGGGPAADGTYDVSFALFETQQALKAVWSEGPVKLTVTGGRFSHTLGSKAPLDAAKLAAMKAAWLRITVVGSPPLPPVQLAASPYALVAERVACTGCLAGAQLADGAIAASKVSFPYAGSKTKGGPAADLACTGCVSASEMKFDGDIDLGGNSLKAKNGTFTGDLAAATVTATAFIGDGSKLTGVKPAPATCKKGQVVQGIAADGSLICVAGSVPKDGLDEVSNGLLTNQFTETQGASGALAIPDNTGADATSTLTVPDWGAAQGLRVRVKLSNTDLSTVRVKVLPPDDKKTGIVLCDPCGKTDEKALDLAWPKDAKPKSGDLGKYVGTNPKGLWTLVVTDTSFCVVQKPGNATLCKTSDKTDGQLIDWSVEVDTLSSKKVSANGALQLKPQLSAPTACNTSNMGTMYFDAKAKVVRYCDGDVWRTLADSCGNGVLDPNEECDDGNNANGDGCSNTCIAAYGSLKTKPGTSCLEILGKWKAAGETAKDGDYWIKAPKGQVIQVACDMSSEGGGYTYFPIASGKTTSRSTDDNSCKDYGLDIVYPRSKAQWTWMLAKYGSSFFATVPGVTKPANGGNYTGCIMRNPTSYGSGCKDWKVPDGGRWWLRDATFSEPNGDYTANCWLSMYKHTPGDIQFNDGNCSYSTKKYVCSTNDKK